MHVVNYERRKTMKQIELECSDSAAGTIVGVLKQLEEVGKNGLTRTIRIGGDEKIFGNGTDTINNIKIDGTMDNNPYIPSIPTRKRRNTMSDNSNTGNDSGDGSNVVNLSTPPVSTLTSGVPSNDDTVIADVIKEFTDGGKQFTAFDVSKEVIKRGVNQKHGQIKRTIHNLMTNNSNYTRSLISIQNVSINPFLYYPVNSDPSNYFVTNDVVGCVV